MQCKLAEEPVYLHAQQLQWKNNPIMKHDQKDYLRRGTQLKLLKTAYFKQHSST